MGDENWRGKVREEFHEVVRMESRHATVPCYKLEPHVRIDYYFSKSNLTPKNEFPTI